MNPITATLLDVAFISFLLAVGTAIGWLAASILWSAKYQRCRKDAWAEARRHYARHLHETLTRL
jgi:uncharacterized membrane protein YccC